ncbi:MAG: 30S ribosomal protein S20 [Nitrospirae bacterium]|nr:30S ribosomal protein S20 [Nitrospirota bacterium]
MPAKAAPKKNLSALKRARQAEKRNVRNKAIRTCVKTIINKVNSAVTANNKEEANKALIEAVRTLNMAAARDVIHRNTASRKISRLTRKVNALSGAGAA